jgi:hypothetical protein
MGLVRLLLFSILNAWFYFFSPHISSASNLFQVSNFSNDKTWIHCHLRKSATPSHQITISWKFLCMYDQVHSVLCSQWICQIPSPENVKVRSLYPVHWWKHSSCKRWAPCLARLAYFQHTYQDWFYFIYLAGWSVNWCLHYKIWWRKSFHDPQSGRQVCIRGPWWVPLTQYQRWESYWMGTRAIGCYCTAVDLDVEGKISRSTTGQWLLMPKFTN